MAWTWRNHRELGALLFERDDTLNPMSVKLSDMQKWVLDLEDFMGRPADANEQLLRAIQKAWYDEWKREFGGD